MIVSAKEEIFITQLKSQDKDAFSRLYDDYSPTLYGILLKILKSEALAEDVLQESFVKIWKNMDRFDRTKGSLFSWMLNIARNGAIDVLRSKNFKQTVKNQTLANNVGMPVDHGTERQVDGIGVVGMLDKLNPEQREIIDLLYFKGYTQAEASESLAVPLGTVKTRARAALKNLRNYLHGE